jgi:hypothetical protein
MAAPGRQLGVQKELRREGIPDDTFVTPNLYNKLVTKECFHLILNNLAAAIKRKPTRDEGEQLLRFIQQSPAERYYNRPIVEVERAIPIDFLRRQREVDRTYREHEDVDRLSGLDDVEGGLHGYQSKELKQFTQNENAYKIRYAPDRRGNALVDRDRVAGLRSSPNSVAPAASLPYGPNGPAGPVSSNISTPGQPATGGSGALSDEILKTFIPLSKALEQFIDPVNIEQIQQQSRQLYNTPDNLALVVQDVWFDNRNSRSDAEIGPNEIGWYLHTSGQQGQRGNVRMEDVLQNIVVIQVFPFRIPITKATDAYYQKVTLVIKELGHQNIPMSEYLDPTQNIPTTFRMTMEFDVERREKDQLYLKPTGDGLFRLREPFPELSTFTVGFRTPYQPLLLLPSEIAFTLTYGNPTILTSVVAHNITSANLIYIYNSNSGNSALDLLLNRVGGWYATRLTPTTISIQANTSALTGSESVNVFIGERRVNFRIRFISLDA